ncbi:hypothetical protein AR457_09715 [Streptomyces agglomeratus]|uniref:hypothetical protein n=1 Tax=Streptomyces agglomeratus TaxID=285458 RepID=UPI000854B8C4|nr:hypothetical protein [Streptomyces agglomeratus]OEJ41287.1 hypothetical protein BGK70_26955 [Streptomyces agglomeratus]OEJ44336.1 hypothetical protein AR457_09715 [Streptomyces agglomeratus]OEJ61155.1 hypothetical protein BGM19_27190 [Streptomyces agglomeratus]
MFGSAQYGRRRGAALAASAVLFAGVAGCGGGEDGRDDKKPGDRGRATASAGPRALTEAQLTAASFTDGETVGKYTASEFTLGAPHGDDYTADPAVCQPLVSLAADVTDHDLRSEVNRRVDVPDEMLGTTVAVQLRSYGRGDAARVMKALARAGEKCADGFTEVRAVARGKYLKVEPVRAPGFGAGADEARAYHFTILDVKGKLKLHEYLTVVRSGSVTLSFRADLLGTKDIGGVPREVTDAQWEKFRAAVAAG